MPLRTTATVGAGLRHIERNESRALVMYEPGNMTRYMVVVVRLGGEFAAEIGAYPTGYTVSIVNFRKARTLVLSAPAFLHPDYVAEEMGIGVSDAAVIAELLAYLYPLDIEAPAAAE